MYILVSHFVLNTDFISNSDQPVKLMADLFQPGMKESEKGQDSKVGVLLELGWEGPPFGHQY